MDPQLSLPGQSQSSTLARIHETSAKFQRYKILLRRRWWFLMLTASIGVCFQALTITGKPPEYISLAKLVAGGKMVNNSSGPQYMEYLQDFYGTIIETLESSEMRRKALDRVRALNPDLKEADVDVKVSQNKGSAIFNVLAVGAEPKYTRAFLDALLDEFRSFRESIREQQRNKALTALAEDVVNRERQVKDHEIKLQQFRVNNPMVRLAGDRNQPAELRMSKILEQETLVRRQSMLELAEKDLDAALVQKEKAMTTAATQGGGASPKDSAAAAGTSGTSKLTHDAPPGFTRAESDYRNTKRELFSLKTDREALLQTLQPAHPDVIDIDRRITKSTNLLGSLNDEIRDEVAAERVAVDRELKSVVADIAKYTTEASDLQAKLDEHSMLQRRLEESSSAHREMLDLVRKFTVSEDMAGDAVAIMERATGAVQDVQQAWAVRILVGLGIGLGLGVVVLLLFDRLDDRMNSFSEFQNLFPHEAILGQIPEQRQRGDVALLRSNDDRHLYAEAFRNVRSSVLFKNWRGKPPKTILVTSAVPNEGKTTVTSNLAITMALAGARVLLADCDLRRGGVSELFKLPVSPGLSEVLRGKTHWRDAVQETSTRNLDLLARGEVFDQTSEMLLSRTADEMLKEMSEEYDYVIFDSAPVLVADDTGSFAPKLDCVLFVVRMSSTMARLSGKALDLLYDRQVNVGGVILNRSSSSLKEYTYYNYASYYYTPKAPQPDQQDAVPPASSAK